MELATGGVHLAWTACSYRSKQPTPSTPGIVVLANRDPIAYALGFLDCKDISARCMLSIFQFFATKTDASVLRMLNGSPAERLLAPIADYITAKCDAQSFCVAGFLACARLSVSLARLPSACWRLSQIA